MSSTGINPNAPALVSLPDIAHGVDAALLGEEAAPPPPSKPEPLPPQTAGQMLRRAREAQGLHVAALAVSLKVPVRKLEALEADQLREPEDAVFVRALAGSVCRSLKIDAAPVLALLPQSSRVRLDSDERAINRQFLGSAVPARASWAEQLSRPMLLVAVALMLGAAVLVFLPDLKAKMEASASASSSATAQSAGSPSVSALGSAVPAAPLAPASVAVAPPVAGGETVIGAPREPVAPAGSGASPAAASPVAVASSAAGLMMAPSLSASSANAAPTGNDSVAIKATGPVWVDVTDASGKIQLRKTLATGEVAGASGALPLKVTIGRADSVQVSVRGKPFDIAPHNRENIARFEVK